MITRNIALLLLCLSTEAAAVEEGRATSPDTAYRLQPGDVLKISVWKEEELTRDILVRPDGGLNFPLVGEVNVTGSTVQELDDTITERLSDFIPDPEVTVSVTQIAGNTIFVVGKVNRPGQFVAARKLDVIQAIGMAGGLNRFAAGDDIKVLRRIDGVMEAIPFRYSDIEDGENLEQNILLQPGDVVIIP